MARPRNNSSYDQNYEYYSGNYNPGIVDFGQLNFYNPKDTEFLAQISANRQQRYDVAQGELAKHLERMSAADFSALPLDVRQQLEYELDKNIANVYENVVTNYDSDFGRALPEINNALAKDRKLLYEGEQENKRYAQALAEYQSLSAQGKAPRVIEYDEDTKSFTPRTISFEEYHYLPTFDEKGKFVPGVYNPLRGAGEHEQFIKTNFSNEISNIVKSITPKLTTREGIDFLKSGSVKGLSEKEIKKRIFDDEGNLTVKGKQMVETFRNSPQAEVEFGKYYHDDKALGKYLVDVISSQVYQSVIDNYSTYTKPSNGSSNLGLLSNTIARIPFGTIKPSERPRVSKEKTFVGKFLEKALGTDKSASGEPLGPGGTPTGWMFSDTEEKKKSETIDFYTTRYRDAMNILLKKKGYGDIEKAIPEQKIEAAKDLSSYLDAKSTGTRHIFNIMDPVVNEYIVDGILSTLYRSSDRKGKNIFDELKGDGSVKNRNVSLPDKKKIISVGVDPLGAGFIFNTEDGAYRLSLYEEDDPYAVQSPTAKGINMHESVQAINLDMFDMSSLFVNGVTKENSSMFYARVNEVIETESGPIEVKPVYILESDYKDPRMDRIVKVYVDPNNFEAVPIPPRYYNTMDEALDSYLQNLAILLNPLSRGM